MAEPAARVEPETSQEMPAPMHVTLDRATYDRLHELARRWALPVERVVARLVAEAEGSDRALARGADGLSTDGLDPDEDAYWQALHDLTGEENERAEVTPSRAPAR